MCSVNTTQYSSVLSSPTKAVSSNTAHKETVWESGDTLSTSATSESSALRDSSSGSDTPTQESNSCKLTTYEIKEIPTSDDIIRPDLFAVLVSGSLAINTKEKIVICDHTAKRIHYINDQGKILKAIGVDVHLKRPTVVRIGSSDSVFVLDTGNGLVHCFSSGGDQLYEIVSLSSVHPSALAARLVETPSMFVVAARKCVHLFLDGALTAKVELGDQDGNAVAVTKMICDVQGLLWVIDDRGLIMRYKSLLEMF